MPGANTADAPTAVTVVIRIGDQRLTGTLADSPATRDLVAQLPLTLTMSDHGSVEKVAALPDPLATDGAPDGADPAVGDIGYYAPWNNLVLYYGNQSYHDGIVRLGTLAGDLTAVAGRGDVSVSLERSPE
jgi:hypothetical protein